MQVDLLKVKLHKKIKDKKTGEERYLVSNAVRIGNKLVLIKPVFNEDYKVLDAFSDFIDLNKHD